MASGFEVIVLSSFWERVGEYCGKAGAVSSLGPASMVGLLSLFASNSLKRSQILLDPCAYFYQRETRDV